MTPRLYIAIPAYNRRAIVEQCVPTITDLMRDEVSGVRVNDDAVIIYDDGSTEYNPAELHLGQTGFVCGPSMGIDAQRRKHILEFWGNREIHGCTHLYLTDSDCFHDPAWRTGLLALQEEHGGAPVCGYRTKTHADYQNNVFRDVPTENVIWQRFAPGTSYLLTLAHVEKIVQWMPAKWSWDWAVPGLLGYKFAVSRVSYLDHIDIGGLHSPESGVGRERATNPTSWLVAKRAEILSNLGLKDAQ